ncbi:MAG: type II toxin-antitoxin system RatA family toxin [Rhodomicrobium sp.]|jgi:coenzyme Q-binding protein COQ10
MPSFETTRRVRHSAADMFALVADVEQYPKFVPLCQDLRVIKRDNNGDVETIIANMTVAYKMFSESFTSRVRLKPAGNLIMVEYLDGPFRKLDNRWTFLPLNERESRVKFYLDYEFRAKPLQILMGAVFDRAFRKFSTAFEARADEVYGKRPYPAPSAEPEPSPAGG